MLNRIKEQFGRLAAPVVFTGVVGAGAVDQAVNDGLVTKEVGSVLSDAAFPKANAAAPDYVAQPDPTDVTYGFSLPTEADTDGDGAADWVNIWGSGGDASKVTEVGNTSPYFLGVDSDGDNSPDLLMMTTDGNWSVVSDLAADFVYPNGYVANRDKLVIESIRTGDTSVVSGYGTSGSATASDTYSYATGRASLDDATEAVYSTYDNGSENKPAIFTSTGATYQPSLDTSLEEISLICDTTAAVCAFTNNADDQVYVMDMSTGTAYPTGAYGEPTNFQPAHGAFGNRFTVQDYTAGYEETDIEDPTTILTEEVDTGDTGVVEEDTAADTAVEEDTATDTGVVTDTADSATDSSDSDTATTDPVDSDGDGVPDSEDCDPADSSVSAQSTWYRDADGDGAGDPNVSQAACEQPAGYVSNVTDCNDADSSLPNEYGDCPTGSVEVADGVYVTLASGDITSDEITTEEDGSTRIALEEGDSGRLSVDALAEDGVILDSGLLGTEATVETGDVVDFGMGYYPGAEANVAPQGPRPPSGDSDTDSMVGCSNECAADGAQPDAVTCDYVTDAQRSSGDAYDGLFTLSSEQGDIEVSGLLDWQGTTIHPADGVVPTSDREWCIPTQEDTATDTATDTAAYETGSTVDTDTGSSVQSQTPPSTEEGCGGCDTGGNSGLAVVGLAMAAGTLASRRRR